jgi:DNA-binding transcriptional ArsR family regulator
LNLNNYLKDLFNGKDFKVFINRGYNIVPHCIRRCVRLSQEEKLLLIEIYSLYNDEKGYAYPTQLTLGMYLGLSPSSISRSLNSLEEKGFISSKGKKGGKKRYFPSFNLKDNPYLVLSEAFHFAVKIINEEIHGEANGDWAPALLSYVNVRKVDEFTSKDYYGKCLRNYTLCPDQSVNDLIGAITDYVATHIEGSITIDWVEKVNLHNKKRKKTNIYPNNTKETKRNRLATLDSDDEWLRDQGYLD